MRKVQWNDGLPVSISCFLTHSCSVTVEQPIIGAIDSTAAHNNGRSLRASCASRAARSLTSGEYLFVLLIVAPFSQVMEPPQFPGRFRSAPDLDRGDLAVGELLARGNGNGNGANYSEPLYCRTLLHHITANHFARKIRGNVTERATLTVTKW